MVLYWDGAVLDGPDYLLRLSDPWKEGGFPSAEPLSATLSRPVEVPGGSL